MISGRTCDINLKYKGGIKMQKKKITKRQRKALHENAMVKHSIKFGQKIALGTVSYIGANPVFNMETGVKVRGGIPFVRA